jgi:hypothetical protein
MRTLQDLRDVAEPAWPTLQSWISGAVHPVEVLPVEPSRAEDTLVQLQVTARSPLGALALHTGGLRVDHGWLHILGSGPGPLNLAESNGLTHRSGPPPLLQVAFDVLGGRFAINGGALPGAAGEVCHRAPDTLRWEPMGLGHGDFIAWAMGAGLKAFYEPLRWPGWEAEVRALAVDQGIHTYPPLYTREGRSPARGSRRAVPIAELLAHLDAVEVQLRDVPEGAQLKFVIKDG